MPQKSDFVIEVSQTSLVVSYTLAMCNELIEKTILYLNFGIYFWIFDFYYVSEMHVISNRNIFLVADFFLFLNCGNCSSLVQTGNTESNKLCAAKHCTSLVLIENRETSRISFSACQLASFVVHFLIEKFETN